MSEGPRLLPRKTKGHTGETWYKIIGYADTVEEAQIKIDGRTWPLDGEPVQFGTKIPYE